MSPFGQNSHMVVPHIQDKQGLGWIWYKKDNMMDFSGYLSKTGYNIQFWEGNILNEHGHGQLPVLNKIDFSSDTPAFDR